MGVWSYNYISNYIHRKFKCLWNIVLNRLCICPTHNLSGINHMDGIIIPKNGISVTSLVFLRNHAKDCQVSLLPLLKTIRRGTTYYHRVVWNYLRFLWRSESINHVKNIVSVIRIKYDLISLISKSSYKTPILSSHGRLSHKRYIFLIEITQNLKTTRCRF